MKLQAQDYLTQVRDQYEDYPYPLRNPEDERNRLLITSTARMDKIITYCFGGRLNLDLPFRILVAGGGTGDGAICFAEQLRSYPNTQIVYLDISHNSMEIAKKRAEIRNLTNIQFIHGSILQLAELGLEHFDLIECTGVLHHLASPTKGLEALASVLNATGAISIMLYAKYGRTGVYMLQDAMRQFTPIAKNKQDQVERCKRLIKSVNPSNLAISGMLKSARQEINDNQDVGIFDLFLHPQDVCYTVPEIYTLARNVNLQVTAFTANFSDGGRLIYNPRSYIHDSQLLQDVLKLPLENQQAIAEILNGKISRHAFFLSKQPAQKINMRDDSVIPAINFSTPPETLEKIIYTLENSKESFEFKLPPFGTALRVAITPNLALLAKQINGSRNLGEIYNAVQQQNPSATKENLQAEILPFLSILSGIDLLCFRYEGTPQFTIPSPPKNNI